MENSKDEKKLNVLNFPEDKISTLLPGIEIPSSDNLRPKDIMKIQAQLIIGFLSGKIESSLARDLTYYLDVYLHAFQATIIEARVKGLEEMENQARTIFNTQVDNQNEN